MPARARRDGRRDRSKGARQRRRHRRRSGAGRGGGITLCRPHVSAPGADGESAPASTKKPLSLRGRALRLLARREYSRRELERKLQPHTNDADALIALLDDLQAQGWLSEQRVAEMLVRHAAGRYGARRVLARLREKGIDPEILMQARAQLRAVELTSARDAWSRRFGKPPADRADRARQARFLEARGFSSEVVARLLRGAVDD
ncbi:MAG: recombination regulator RecX [Betaproteobacteria bacterium]